MDVFFISLLFFYTLITWRLDFVTLFLGLFFFLLTISKEFNTCLKQQQQTRVYIFMHTFTLYYFYNIFNIASYMLGTELELYSECVRWIQQGNVFFWLVYR